MLSRQSDSRELVPTVHHADHPAVRARMVERYGSRTMAGAAALRHLAESAVGADRWNKGKYAIYWFDSEGVEIRSAGGFESVGDAAAARWPLLVEAVEEEIAQWEASQ